MKIGLTNTSGIMLKRVKLGRVSYDLVFTYNYRDDSWYINIKDEITGIRINQGRELFRNQYGYLTAEGDVTKTGFNEVTWNDLA
jgi:hypothetical protein